MLIGAVNNQLQYARFLSMGVKWLVLVLTAAMVLDHLQIGGNIVELAFGILFGGIVLTLVACRRPGLARPGHRARSNAPPIGRNEPPIPGSEARPEVEQTLRHF